MQLCFLFYVVIIRPNEKVKDNIIEVMNDLVFCTIIILHMVWQSKPDWTDVRVQVVLFIMMGSGILVGVIVMLEFLRELFKKILEVLHIGKKNKNRLFRKTKMRSPSIYAQE